MIIAITHEDFETADAGNYGGFVNVGGVRVPATLSDRECNLRIDVYQAVSALLNRPLMEDEVSDLDEHYSPGTDFEVNSPSRFEQTLRI